MHSKDVARGMAVLIIVHLMGGMFVMMVHTLQHVLVLCIKLPYLQLIPYSQET